MPTNEEVLEKLDEVRKDVRTLTTLCAALAVSVLPDDDGSLRSLYEEVSRRHNPAGIAADILTQIRDILSRPEQ